MNIDQIWTEKYRPTKLEDIILSPNNRKYFSSLKSISNNYLFVGGFGIGKNTVASYLRNKFAPDSTLYINASAESGIDVVRTKISDFIGTCSFDGSPKLVILSEFDGFSNAGQDALREIMEEYMDDVRFILTANFNFKIREAIKSRCQTFNFNLDIKEIGARLVKILNAENIKNWKDPENKDAINKLIKRHYPDIRKTINELQHCCIDGMFIPPIVSDSSFARKVVDMLKEKKSPFTIRQYVLDNDVEFGNDFHSLIRAMFDCYIVDENVKGAIMCANFGAEHGKVSDVEMNFSNLIFNLSKHE